MSANTKAQQQCDWWHAVPCPPQLPCWIQPLFATRCLARGQLGPSRTTKHPALGTHSHQLPPPLTMGAFFSMSGTMTYRTRLPRMKMCSMCDTWQDTAAGMRIPERWADRADEQANDTTNAGGSCSPRSATHPAQQHTQQYAAQCTAGSMDSAGKPCRGHGHRCAAPCHLAPSPARL